VYLHDKYHVKEALLFIGYISSNNSLYTYLEEVGYRLVFKPVTIDSDGKPKGNVDAELVLYTAAVEYESYEKAIIVSGDGDFYCLYDYLLAHNKLSRIVIPNKHSYSKLLWDFKDNIDYMNNLKSKLEIKMGVSRLRTKP
jgi:uncharacterized LabA/DUF88 family protein